MPDEHLQESEYTKEPSNETEDLPTQTVSDADWRGATPRRIGQYHIKRAIASGGMGTVYEATQERPRRVVAVKVMKQGIVSRSALRRFEYESQVLARLRHPGIAQVYEAGTHREHGAPGAAVPFFAMEYVPNAKPISSYVADKKLKRPELLELFAKVCDAVHHGHQKGIIHRDLKPGNILVDSKGQPKIIDFGVARSTDSDMAVTTLQTNVGQLVGTLQYMSPEQCDADPHDIDTRSDVYALGIVLYQLLCGRVPYDVSKVAMHEATRVIREEHPAKLSAVNSALRGDVETIALKALEKDRERRYQSAADLARDIRRFLKHEAISARPPSIVYQLRMFARRHKAGVGAIAAVFVVLVAGVIISTSSYLRAESARTEADVRRVHAEEVTDFLNTTLASVDPAKAQGREVTVKMMLDQAAEKIDAAFPTMPLAEASLRVTIGYTYRQLGKYAEAERQLSEALKLRRRHLPNDHLDVAKAASALGAVLEARAEYDGAEKLWSEALTIRRNALGDEHELVIESRNRLGVLLYRRGHYAALEPLWRETLAVRRKLLGNEHEDVARSLNNLGALLMAKGEYAEAESLFRESLAIRRKLFDDVHPYVAESLNNLCSVLTEVGDYQAAEPLARETLEIHRKLHGDEHADIARSLANLAAIVCKRGDCPAAEPLIRDAIAMQRKLVGGVHQDLASMLRTLAEILLDKGDPSSAERALGESLTILGKLRLPEDDLTTALVRSQLGACLTVLERYEEAEPLLVRAYETIARVREASDAYAVEALKRVVGLYDAWGKSDKAANYRAKLPGGG